ncbi:MAG: GHKL domain-containing protein [Kiritimatiellae bacterium]|nr:GHKL domain-containing protein [Kiritimatiellia bacterium]
MNPEDNSRESRLLTAYSHYKRELYLRRTKLACILGVVAILGGAPLDFFVYPEFAKVFSVIRITSAGLILAILGLLFTVPCKKYIDTLQFSCVTIMILHLCVMIGWSEGITSPYYIAIALTISISCLLLPWTLAECLSPCLCALTLYAAGCVINYFFTGIHSENWVGLAVHNIYFMLIVPLTCITGSHFAEQQRFREFQLQFELDQSKQEVEKSYEKLSELDKAKSQFFANISHELRTPLTLIISPLGELTNNLGRTNPDLKNMLDIMYGNAMRLLALINDLLDLVRLEEGKLELRKEPVDLKKLLPGLTSSIQHTAKHNKLRVETELSPTASLLVRADKSRLEKVFLNLLFNAIKFTPAGGVIRLLGREEDETIVIDVQDTGIGISEDKLVSVFDRFWQEDGSETRQRQGTGIGLALVKEIMEHHKGTVHVQSKKGEGTTFSVHLPKISEQELEAATITEPPEEDTWLTDLYQKAQQYQGDLLAE